MFLLADVVFFECFVPILGGGTTEQPPDPGIHPWDPVFGTFDAVWRCISYIEDPDNLDLSPTKDSSGKERC